MIKTIDDLIEQLKINRGSKLRCRFNGDADEYNAFSLAIRHAEELKQNMEAHHIENKLEKVEDKYRWRKVEDELPDTSRTLRAKAELYNSDYPVWYLSDYGFIAEEDGYGLSFGLADVTHWRYQDKPDDSN